MGIDHFEDSMIIVSQIFAALEPKSATIATAESCTGGILATLLTHLPGSSDFYIGGITSYSDKAKINLLGVEEKSLQLSGAVSRDVAAEMAEGAQQRLGADYTIAITGIAGPDGGSDDKPVGTIWCGFTTPSDTYTQDYHLKGNRAAIRSEIARLALNQIYKYISEGL